MSAPELRLPEGIKLPDGSRWEGRHVRLDHFEGPLDLLLFLLRDKKMEIKQINISSITEEFLAYVRTLEETRVTSTDLLDEVGDFLVMAATLVQLKTRELLPREEAQALEESEMTRADLIRLLEEYERFKAAAADLDGRRLEREKIFLRDRPLVEPTQEHVLKVDLTKLLEAFRTVLRRAPQEQVKELARVQVRIEDCIEEIRYRLETEESILFEELFDPAGGRLKIIAVFLALLELMKMEEVIAAQIEPFGPIRILRREPGAIRTVIDEEETND